MSYALVLLAILLRVVWVLLVPTKPVGDFAMYVESATHLATHGALDSEYVYMPGYVFLLATIQWFGGGLLAMKLFGAITAGLGTGAVIGLGRILSYGNRRVGWLAGLLYALWPAGIAITSVTGTDMPAAVVVGASAYALLRFSATRPWLAAVLFGVLTGLGAYLRAIVVPLAAFSILVFRAQTHSWRRSAVYAALACAVALTALSPWALRNRLRYGETFFTDSHGGLTLLVGANPNTDGRYSRSLNRMFEDVTGFRLLSEPHRQADRTSLAIARTWFAFDPIYSLSLLASKAERLFAHERALLYWPIFRKGVLPDPWKGFFSRHQAFIEGLADSFWFLFLGLGIYGCTLALLRRQWLTVSLVPQALALAALYILIFAEQRYRLPITLLFFPLVAYAGNEIVTLLKNRHGRFKRELVFPIVIACVLYSLAHLTLFAAGQLREAHRWSVHECTLDGKAAFCQWRPTTPGIRPDGLPTLKGVWNGIGISLSSTADQPTISVDLTLPQSLDPQTGTHTLRAQFDLAPFEGALPTPHGTIQLYADDVLLPSTIDLSTVAEATRRREVLQFETTLPHRPHRLRVILHPSHGSPPMRLWLSGLTVELSDEATLGG